MARLPPTGKIGRCRSPIFAQRVRTCAQVTRTVSFSSYCSRIMLTCSRLSDLISDFELCFEGKNVPSLIEILSRLTVDLPDNGFQEDGASQVDFCSIFIRAREEIQTYQELLVWLLRRGLVQRLHLRVRIVVSKEVKQRVYEEAVRNLEGTIWDRRRPTGPDGVPRQLENSGTLNGMESVASDRFGNLEESTILSNPYQITGLEKRWLREISKDKEPVAVSLFERYTCLGYCKRVSH